MHVAMRMIRKCCRTVLRFRVYAYQCFSCEIFQGFSTTVKLCTRISKFFRGVAKQFDYVQNRFIFVAEQFCYVRDYFRFVAELFGYIAK